MSRSTTTVAGTNIGISTFRYDYVSHTNHRHRYLYTRQTPSTSLIRLGEKKHVFATSPAHSGSSNRPTDRNGDRVDNLVEKYANWYIYLDPEEKKNSVNSQRQGTYDR